MTKPKRISVNSVSIDLRELISDGSSIDEVIVRLQHIKALVKNAVDKFERDNIEDTISLDWTFDRDWCDVNVNIAFTRPETTEP